MAGVAARLAYVFVLAPDVVGVGDWNFFHWQANLLADGRGYIDPFAWGNEGARIPSASHPPVWPTVLAPMSLLGGTDPLAHRAVGCLVGGIVIALLGLLGRRVGGARVGLLAAAIGAAYPLLIAADGALMSETVYGLFVALALLAAYRLLDRPTSVAALALGLVISLAALTRTEALLFLPLLVAPVAWRAAPGWGRRAGLVALACLATAVTIAPWTIRNWSAFDRPVLISTNEGAVIAGANCDLAYHGPDVAYWKIECIPERTSANESVDSAKWRRQGLEYVRENAGELPRVAALRVLRTWDLYQPRRMVLFAEGRHIRAEQAGIAVYFVLLALAIYGVVVLRRRGAPLLVLLSPFVLVTVTSVLSYGIPRFRHAAEIPIVVLAAVGAAALLDRRRGARERATGERPDVRAATPSGAS